VPECRASSIWCVSRPARAAPKSSRAVRTQQMIADTLTPEFHSRLIARSVSLVHEIRANAETFAQAAATHLGNRRIGDQIGALLAGAYSLHSTRRISYDDALAWIQDQDWEGSTAAEADADEDRLLAYLMEQVRRVNRPNGSALDLSIGELIDFAAPSTHTDRPISQADADAELRRCGIRYEHADAPAGTSAPGIWVANSHSMLAHMLSRTAWANNWGTTLARVKGALKPPDKIRITRGKAGRPVRAVYVPLATDV